MTYESLFSSISIRGLRFKNRIVMPPMATNFGIVTDQSIAYYTKRALGGVGSIIIEGVPTHLFRDRQFQDRLKLLADSIHRSNVNAFVQLTIRSNPQPRRDVTDISVDEIRSFIDDLVYAGKVCLEAGFDGVEPHGAHGFIINQFFSPIFNRRDDEYGGDVYRRMRFSLEVIRGLKSIANDKFLILYRHTPVEWREGGYSLDDTILFGRELKKEGLDILDISPSTPPGSYDYGILAREVKRQVDIPVIMVGKMHIPDLAEDRIKNGYADFVAIGRALLADPSLPKKIQDGRFALINSCKQCNIMCHGYLRRRIPISCVMNPAVGREFLERGSWSNNLR
jgi:2,4-dienoyl-CoA reductase-like NADH-dependent reductase (Old Yellow Enzyme family)